MQQQPTEAKATTIKMNNDSLYVRREKKKVAHLKYTSKASFQKYIQDTVKVMGTTMGPSHGNAQISREALVIADSIIMGLYRDIAKEAKKLMVASKRRTLMAWDIQGAVMLRLQGEVSRHAVAEASRAVAAYADLAKRR